VQIALTFDNLGEAADLERGLSPADAPLGRHPSVTTVLPRLLQELDDLGLRATFCVEALNCELYPEALTGIAARGHELAMHAWRHEAWGDLGAGREDELLGSGRAAFDALGLDVRGFRPPGGRLTAASPALLARLAAGDTPTLILHPFLMVGSDGWAAARTVLRALPGRPVATAGEIAAAL
jgi:peptidoglycan/xylan/chitin deacetylase (PgdA/CDA1 family)